MLTYAVYRCLYGEDFVQESIRSILPFVDKIFVFYTNTVWGGVTSCVYKNEEVVFPEYFGNIVGKIHKLYEPKVHILYDHVDTPRNQFTHLMNDRILPYHARPDVAIFIEVDHVFRQDQFILAISEFLASGVLVANCSQVELWKTFEYEAVRIGKPRWSTLFWDVKALTDLDIKKFPPTGFGGEPVVNYRSFRQLQAKVHNLGFCFSQRTMFWKHMTALGFAKKIGDSQPNEMWFEEKWLDWNYERNNKDLEISKGYEHLIPHAILYTGELPEVLNA